MNGIAFASLWEGVAGLAHGEDVELDVPGRHPGSTFRGLA